MQDLSVLVYTDYWVNAIFPGPFKDIQPHFMTDFVVFTCFQRKDVFMFR